MRTVQIAAVVVFCAGSVTSALADAYDPPVSYYAGATGSGATLKSQLAAAMSAGHVQRTYGDFRTSAAFHDADPNVAGRVWLVYNRGSVPSVWDSGLTWNREHVWPESRQPGSVNNSSTGNLGDPHALRPCNPSINTSRGNSPFGFASTTGGYGSQGSFYFPGDFDKGDIARSLFYSDTRWSSLGLSLVNSTPTGNQMGNLDSLIAWNYLDPPDDFERRRNHVIWGAEGNPFPTHNRNAYIDNPELVWSIYVDQMNDSSLYVGSSPSSDFSSTVTLLMDDSLVGDPVPSTEAILYKNGLDGTYYEVIPGPGAQSAQAGKFNAFPISSTSPDAAMLSVGFDASATAASGAKSVTITIDNRDITTGAGLGMAANDGDDTITLEMVVLDHANGSFDSPADLDTISIDFGTIAQGTGAAMIVFDVYNLPANDPAFVAALDIEADGVSGDADRLDTTLGSTTIQSQQSFVATLDDSVSGVFSATYTYQTYDDLTIPTSQPGTVLTIHLSGTVVPVLCTGDVTGDQIVNVDDLNAVLSAWGMNVGMGSPIDLANNDGFVDVDDLNVVLGNWGTDCN
ncbi:MAG: endonuclease [Phycisphaeraceae bacterium]|nr:endonuclease [Phycisphaerales bacterium]MCB9843530.1 endonuclease [Phycisphaeraceae bacterium]